MPSSGASAANAEPTFPVLEQKAAGEDGIERCLPWCMAHNSQA